MSLTFMDLPLSRRLERCEGAISASLIETHARTEPAAGATWMEVAGAYALFDGPESPLSQTFGLGLFGACGAAELARLEAFFSERGAGTEHELSPLAGVPLARALVERGYLPIEHSAVLVLTLDHAVDEERRPGALVGRVATPDQREPWVACSVAGWGSEPGAGSFVEGVAGRAFATPRMASVYVEDEGVMVATGSFGMHEGVALLSGASTHPQHRGRGAQRALLAARLALAQDRGCDLALMVAEPGSGSQRNAERSGFRVAYTRTKWRRARDA